MFYRLYMYIHTHMHTVEYIHVMEWNVKCIITYIVSGIGGHKHCTPSASDTSKGRERNGSDDVTFYDCMMGYSRLNIYDTNRSFYQIRWSLIKSNWAKLVF